MTVHHPLPAQVIGQVLGGDALKGAHPALQALVVQTPWSDQHIVGVDVSRCDELQSYCGTHVQCGGAGFIGIEIKYTIRADFNLFGTAGEALSEADDVQVF